jgi:hypothetical protein
MSRPSAKHPIFMRTVFVRTVPRNCRPPWSSRLYPTQLGRAQFPPRAPDFHGPGREGRPRRGLSSDHQRRPSPPSLSLCHAQKRPLSLGVGGPNIPAGRSSSDDPRERPSPGNTYSSATSRSSRVALATRSRTATAHSGVPGTHSPAPAAVARARPPPRALGGNQRVTSSHSYSAPLGRRCPGTGHARRRVGRPRESSIHSQSSPPAAPARWAGGEHRGVRKPVPDRRRPAKTHVRGSGRLGDSGAPRTHSRAQTASPSADRRTWRHRGLVPRRPAGRRADVCEAALRHPKYPPMSDGVRPPAPRGVMMPANRPRSHHHRHHPHRRGYKHLRGRMVFSVGAACSGHAAHSTVRERPAPMTAMFAVLAKEGRVQRSLCWCERFRIVREEQQGRRGESSATALAFLSVTPCWT